jgi:mRNA interferase RelE/StbE
MKVELTKRFAKELDKLPRKIQLKVVEAIEHLGEADAFSELEDFKALSGYNNFYRIKLGQYRIGLFFDGDTFLIERIGVRGDFYKSYPPK